MLKICVDTSFLNDLKILAQAEIEECSIILAEDANMLAHAIQDLLDDEPFFDRDLLGKTQWRGEKALDFIGRLLGDFYLHDPIL